MSEGYFFVVRLKKQGAIVLHQVDATSLDKAFGARKTHGDTDKDDKQVDRQFDYIFWNFPHAGCVKGFRDGHPFVGWRHVNLMRKFFRSARPFVAADGGTITIATNAKATGVNAQDMVTFAKKEEFPQCGRWGFDDWCVGVYERAFGDYRDATKRQKLSESGQSDKYRQSKSDDLVYRFKNEVKTPSERMAPLELLKAPSPSEVMMDTVACQCGLICSRDNRSHFADMHFKSSGMHQALDGPSKMEMVEQLLMTFHAFE